MNAVLNLGKYFFAIPFAVFGILHFIGADAMAAMAPGGVIMVYITGLAHLAAAAAIFMGKYDKLAAVLLALMLIIFALAVHLPNMAADGNELGNILKNIALAGGALMYAQTLAKDNSVIG